MKKFILTGTTLLVAAGVAGILTGCSNDDPFGGDGTTGKVVPTVNLDSRVTASDRAGTLKAPQSRAESNAMDVSLDDLTLTLTPKSGGSPFTCKGVSAWDINKEFKVGEYTFEASYGDPAVEGFELPAYYGSETVIVEENRTSSVSLSAQLVNSMVSVEFGDALVKYATDLSAHLQTSGEKIAFATTETRPAYVQPGSATVSVTLTKPNGVSGTVTIPAFTAKARYHHHVKLDLKGGSGDAVLEVIFDDTVTNQDVTIELKDEILNAPAPVVTPKGFNSGEALSFVAGMTTGADLSVDITAQASIASAVMSTKSASLLAKGWPAEIDLTQATAEQQTALKALGLDVLGLFKNPGRMAVVDFSEVTKNIAFIEGGDNSTEITLTVIDTASKSAEPVTLALNAEALEMGLTAVSQAYPDAAGMPIELRLDYNGANPKDEVTFEYNNERGIWEPLEVISIQAAGRAATAYTVMVKAPAIDYSVEIRATCKELVKTTESVLVKQVPFKLAVDEKNVFATKAMLTVTSKKLDPATVAAQGELKLSPAAPSAAKSISGANIRLTGLAAGTTYTATITYDGEESVGLQFTTEAATQLPGAGFDSWTSEKLGDYQYMWRPNSAWGTMNDLTLSQKGSGSGNGRNTGGCAYKATSGTIPANGRSTQSMADGGLLGTNKHSDGHTEGNANLFSDRQHSGTNAALIRTVGWGSGNKASAAISGQHFATCDNTTAGQLYLGSYAADTPNYGYNFTSRPSALSFFYQYATVSAGNGDHGTAEVKVYDASGAIIASGSIDLTEQSGYKEVTIPLTYAAGAAKAARISVVFKSSYIANNAFSGNTSWFHVPGVKNVSGGEYVGSELTIDDVTLKY